MSNASPSDRRLPRQRQPDPRPPGRVPRRGLAALLITLSGAALLLSFRTPSELLAGASADSFMSGPTSADIDPARSVSTAAPAATAASSGPTEPPTAAAEPPPAPQVIAGKAVRTPFGLVQVSLTIDGSGIADVKAMQLPFDRSYSARISRVVEPILRDEALQAQSADIGLISGATYTSTGYAMSLQSAIDQAQSSLKAPA